ncbi:LysR family transcriptional regulator [Mesorhizobium sp. M0772]|uniref:LysR family transcriptional regulator n=1 Tax=Mesorhizobium sp. M0772 TaxID=2956998 RepID=UPI00333D0143
MSEMKDISAAMNKANINITMVRVLTSLSETRSFTKTAERLCLSQSAISHAMKALEEIVGAPLVIRDRRGVAFTATGEAALDAARAALHALGRLVGLREHSIKGRVRLALVSSASVKIAPYALNITSVRHPELAVELLLGTDTEVAEWVDRGAADIGLSYIAGNCQAEELVDDELFVASSQKNSVQGGSFPIRALDGQPFIMSSGGCGPMLAELFQDFGVAPVVILSASDMAALLALVGAGRGLSIAPGLAFPADWQRTVARRPLEPRARRPLLLLFSSSAEATAVRAMCTAIREVATSLRGG